MVNHFEEEVWLQDVHVCVSLVYALIPPRYGIICLIRKCAVFMTVSHCANNHTIGD